MGGGSQYWWVRKGVRQLWITLSQRCPIVLSILGRHVPADNINKTILDTKDDYKGNELQKVAKFMCSPCAFGAKAAFWAG